MVGTPALASWVVTVPEQAMAASAAAKQPNLTVFIEQDNVLQSGVLSRRREYIRRNRI